MHSEIKKKKTFQIEAKKNKHVIKKILSDQAKTKRALVRKREWG